MLMIYINGMVDVVISIHSECAVAIIVRIKGSLNVKDRSLSSLAPCTHWRMKLNVMSGRRWLSN